MKKIVLTYGLTSGALLSGMLVVATLFHDAIGFDRGAVVGYTSMVVAFLLVFFGVRSYRDNVAGGSIRFGRAFAVGALIAAVASLCYVATWEVIYFKFAPDYSVRYAEHVLTKARAEGLSEEAIARKKAEMDQFKEFYDMPVANAAITFLEPLPVALVMSFLTAGILSRRKDGTTAF